MKIEAFFANLRAANEAIAKLNAAGFTKAVADMNDHYVNDRDVNINLAGTETSVSVSGLVLKSDAQGVEGNRSVLAATNPMVSGFGRFEEIYDYNSKVVVDVTPEEETKVKQMLREAGGKLDNPNLIRPEQTDADILLERAIERIEDNL